MIAVSFIFLCAIWGSWAKPPILNYQDSIGQYSFGYSLPEAYRSEYRSSDGLTRGTYSYIDRDGRVQTAEYEAGNELGFQVKLSNKPKELAQPVQNTPQVTASREQYSEQNLNQANGNENEQRSILSQQNVYAENVELPKIVIEEKKFDVPQENLQITPTVATVEAPKEQTLVEVHPLDQKYEITSRTHTEQDLLIPNVPDVPVNVHEPVTYTPEVLAAREAHFKAYQEATKQSAGADENSQNINTVVKNTSFQETATEVPSLDGAQRAENVLQESRNNADVTSQVKLGSELLPPDPESIKTVDAHKSAELESVENLKSIQQNVETVQTVQQGFQNSEELQYRQRIGVAPQEAQGFVPPFVDEKRVVNDLPRIAISNIRKTYTHYKPAGNIRPPLPNQEAQNNNVFLPYNANNKIDTGVGRPETFGYNQYNQYNQDTEPFRVGPELICATGLRVNGAAHLLKSPHHFAVAPTVIAGYPASAISSPVGAFSSGQAASSPSTSTGQQVQYPVGVPVAVPVYPHVDLASLFLQGLLFGLSGIHF